MLLCECIVITFDKRFSLMNLQSDCILQLMTERVFVFMGEQ